MLPSRPPKHECRIEAGLAATWRHLNARMTWKGLGHLVSLISRDRATQHNHSMASNLTFNDDGSMDLDATAGHISPHHVRTDSCISQQEVVDLISPTDAAARTGLKHAGGIAHDVDLPTDLQLSDLDSNDDNGTQAFIPIAPFPAQDGTQAFAPIVPLEVQDTTWSFVPIAPYQTEGRALAIPQPVSTQAQDDTLAFAPITSFLAQHNASAFAVCPPLPGASSIPSGFDYYHVEQPGPRSFSAPYGQQDLCPQKGRPKVCRSRNIQSNTAIEFYDANTGNRSVDQTHPELRHQSVGGLK